MRTFSSLLSKIIFFPLFYSFQIKMAPLAEAVEYIDYIPAER